MVWNTSSFDKVQIDPSTHALIGSTTAHHEIHEGSAFTVFVSDGSVSLNESLTLAFKTSDSAKQLHMVFEAIADKAVNIDILENATWTSSDISGSNKVHNRRRAGNNPSTILNDETTGDSSFEASDRVATFLPDVSVALHPTGESLDRYHLGTGNKIGGDSRGISEWNLNSDTQYAFRLNSETNNADCLIKLDWYEHIDKD